MEIQLNLVNRSDDAGGVNVVIFQKNLADPPDAPAVAWLLVSDFAPGQTFAFTYPTAVTVGAIDSWGHAMPVVSAESGESFTVQSSAQGDILRRTGVAGSAREIDVRNGLAQGAIDALVYRDGRPVAMKTAVAPGQTATFMLQSNLWIGVVPMVQTGQVLDDAIMNNIDTQLSLLGIKDADILMSGGGGGGSPATPYRFELANVVPA
jgi:hypothetical protein